MSSIPQVLALIPARGGSKGLPRKNLSLLQGHPLVAWAVTAGLQACKVTRTICSTDDPEIAEAARKYGAEVPFLRPAELAQDLTLDLPVFQHTLEWLDSHEEWRPDIIIQLRPTSPLRPPGLVDKAIEMLEGDPLATSVRAVCPAPCNPHKMWRLSEDPEMDQPYMKHLLEAPGIDEPYNAPRQALPPVWWQIGAIDAIRAEVIRGGSMSGPRILPLKLDARFAIDIDSEDNIHAAELALHKMDCVRPGQDLNWARIRLLVLDVDGTLTPGTMYYDSEGEALKRFHTHDGQGIGMMRDIGVDVIIITQESSGFAEARGKKVKASHVYTGVSDKCCVLRDICRKSGVLLHEVACVGDDLGDVEMMKAVGRSGGIPCAVADARPEAKAAARYVCPSRGGYGAVRDICDLILSAREKGVIQQPKDLKNSICSSGSEKIEKLVPEACKIQHVISPIIINYKNDSIRRILVCGVGSIGERHIQNLLTLGQTQIAVYRTRNLPYRTPDSDFPLYTDLDRALAEFQPEIAFVTNPTAFHIPVALRCARAGCHLFIEKPVSHTLDGLESLQEELDKHGRFAMIGYMMRFHPLFKQIKEWLEQGEDSPLGRAVFVRACWGEHVSDWHTWEDYHESYAVRPELGGGPALTLSHELDILVWMFGASSEVVAMVSNSSALDIACEHAADFLIRFSDGVTANVHLDYYQRPPQRTWELVGTKGRVTVDYYAGTATFSPGSKGSDPGSVDNRNLIAEAYRLPAGFDRNELFISEIKYFLECLRTGSKPVPGIFDAAEPVRIARNALEPLR